MFQDAYLEEVLNDLEGEPYLQEAMQEQQKKVLSEQQDEAQKVLDRQKKTLPKRTRKKEKLPQVEIAKNEISNIKATVLCDELYNVEKIVDKKKVGKKILYHVKWEGFPTSQNTWEPLNNLKNVKDIVKRYEREFGDYCEEMTNCAQQGSTNITNEVVLLDEAVCKNKVQETSEGLSARQIFKKQRVIDETFGSEVKSNGPSSVPNTILIGKSSSLSIENEPNKRLRK